MSFRSFVLGLLGAALLHAAGVRWIPGFAGSVDLFLVLAVLHALRGREISAQLGGAAAGLIHDALGNGPFGLHGVATTVTSFVVAHAARRLIISDPLPTALIFMGATALERAIAMALSSFFVLEPPDFGQVVLSVLSAGILGLAAFWAGDRGRRSYDRWRRRRKPPH